MKLLTLVVDDEELWEEVFKVILVIEGSAIVRRDS